MKQKKSTRISNEEMVLLYEVVERPDGTKGIGNSFEAKKSEVAALIVDGKAKHEGAPIGVVPEVFYGGVAEVIADGSSDNS